MIPAKSGLLQRCQSVMPMESLVHYTEQSDWSKKELTPTEVAGAILANEIVIDGKKYDKMVIIDARYEYEYSGGHIKGSICLLNLRLILLQDRSTYRKSTKKSGRPA